MTKEKRLQYETAVLLVMTTTFLAFTQQGRVEMDIAKKSIPRMKSKSV